MTIFLGISPVLASWPVELRMDTCLTRSSNLVKVVVILTINRLQLVFPIDYNILPEPTPCCQSISTKASKAHAFSQAWLVGALSLSSPQANPWTCTKSRWGVETCWNLEKSLGTASSKHLALLSYRNLQTLQAIPCSTLQPINWW